MTIEQTQERLTAVLAKRGVLLLLTLVAAVLPRAPVSAEVDPFYAGSYSVYNLGAPSGLPGGTGGLVVAPNDPNTLLIAGDASSPLGAVYSVGLIRDAQHHITGFSGPVAFVASAPWINNITYGPNSVLFYSAYLDDLALIGQIKPGSVAADKVIDLTPAGVHYYLGGLSFVPSGISQAGSLILNSYETEQWYQLTLAPDGTGTFNIAVAESPHSTIAIDNAPEGFAYVAAGNPLFGADAMLLIEIGYTQIRAFDIDADGFPLVATRRTFVSAVEGGDGAAVDPLTGDLLFSSWGLGNDVSVVTGFETPLTATPEPSSLSFIAAGLLMAVPCARRRLFKRGQVATLSGR